MKCPYCQDSETKVVDSRELDDIIRRRRECLKCEKRFTTYERVEHIELIVIKKDGKKEKFDREKLKVGLIRAFEKRPITIEQIEEITDKIEAKLRRRKSNEVSSKVIGEEVIRRLKNIDEIAYLRFASVYKEFENVGEFKKELVQLKS